MTSQIRTRLDDSFALWDSELSTELLGSRVVALSADESANRQEEPDFRSRYHKRSLSRTEAQSV